MQSPEQSTLSDPEVIEVCAQVMAHPISKAHRVE